MFLVAAGLWADPPSEVGRLSLITGPVSFQPGSLDEWAPAMLNYPLSTGDHLWTDLGGRAEVNLGSSAVRLDSGTDFSLLNLDDQTAQIRLGAGSLNIRVRDLDPGSTFEVDTPGASLQLTRAGSYRVDVGENGDARVIVREGGAEVATPGIVFEVLAGQSATISVTDAYSYGVSGAPAIDEWDGWCMVRDQRGDRIVSSPYVPPEMIGAEDLDENGTWSIAVDFGPVWVPRVPVGWAPYRVGHWSWIEPWGWTWIDDAPWGFAPFHYGRWAFVGGQWAWVPGARVARPLYAPALVVFVGGNGWSATGGMEIGWFPLGPQEIYVPPYQVSPAYVQRINMSHVTNFTSASLQRFDINRFQYVNRNMPQAVTVMPQQSFVEGRALSAAIIRLAPSQIIGAPVMGMTAALAPSRESVIGRQLAPGAMVPQPRPEVQRRDVFYRAAPPPSPVPFAARQQALSANPGRPLDPDVLSNLQRVQPPRPAAVNSANPSGANRPQNPPPVPGAPQSIMPQQGGAPLVSPRPQVNIPPGSPQPQPLPQGRPPQQGQQVFVQPSGDAKQTPAPASRDSSQGRNDAAALISSLRNQSLPQAQQHLAAARGSGRRTLDFEALSRQLSAAQATLAKAERDLAAGKTADAMQEAAAAQKQISDIEAAISASQQGRSSDNRGQGDDKRNDSNARPTGR
jgi:hypothetical protein